MSMGHFDDTLFHGASRADAKAVCVFVHGRTQSPADMMENVVQHLDAPSVRFVMPKSDGVAWYDVRAVDPLTEDGRSQLDTALARLSQTIATVEAECPGVPMVLGGFSQGACLSVEYLMRRGPWDGAACFLTGCRVGVSSDDRPVARIEGMPIYASCGDQDPWIPSANHTEMCQILIEQGARLRTDIFPGRDHSVTQTERKALQAMLDALVAQRPVFGLQEMTK